VSDKLEDYPVGIQLLLKEAWETVRKLEMLETEFRAWEGDQAVPRGDRERWRWLGAAKEKDALSK